MSMQRYDALVQSTTGAVIAGATVTVRVKSSGVVATIYSDEILTGKTNPLTSGSDGSFWFYAADDDYTIAATYGGTTYTLGDVTLHSPEAWRQLVVKTASVPVNDSVVLKNDEELLFAVLAGETWEFHILVRLTTSAIGDFKYKFNGPAGSGYTYHQRHEPGAFSEGSCDAIGDTVSALGGVVTDMPLIIGGIFAATAAGTMNFQWAQDTGDAFVDTHVNIGSYLIARKVSLT